MQLSSPRAWGEDVDPSNPLALLRAIPVPAQFLLSCVLARLTGESAVPEAPCPVMDRKEAYRAKKPSRIAETSFSPLYPLWKTASPAQGTAAEHLSDLWRRAGIRGRCTRA